MDQDKAAGINVGGDIRSILEEYKNRLFAEIGFSNLDPEKRKEMEKKLGDVINERIINLVLLNLTNEQVAEFDKLVIPGNNDLVAKYLSENIPGIGDKIANELFAIRQELINKLSNGQQSTTTS